MGGGIEQGGNTASGTLTVTARVSNGTSRHAMPTISNLVYAALLYKDGDTPSEDFVQGTKAADSDNLIFSFQKPDNTSGTFTLEVFAFKEGTDAADFSRNSATFSKAKSGLTIMGDAINVGDIALEVNNLPDLTGTVSLQIKVPAGCMLAIDDTTHFDITDNAPNFTVTQNGTGIPVGTYSVTFTVKKVDETDNTKEEIIHIFTESINVLPGMRTDTWWNGAESSATKEITQGMISSTVYVRGVGGWYETSPYSGTATASDGNSGTYIAPLATIQKAVDKIIAINDGTSEYTIYLDGKFTTSADALADFNAPSLTQKLSVKIVGLSKSEKAVLDGEGAARGIVVGSDDGSSVTQKDVNLTLENLVVQNTKYSGGRGGGITLCCKADNSHLIKNCDIKDNYAAYGSAIYNEYGSLDLQGCVISGNTTGTSGTVYNGQESAILTMSDVKIENNSADNGGGVFLANDSTLKISDASVVIKGNSSSSLSRGKGICVWYGILELSGSAKIDDGVGFPQINSSSHKHEIVIAGPLSESPIATITLPASSYAAGTPILTKGAGAPAITQGICDKFALSDEGWIIVPDGTGSQGVLKVDSDIYVRGTGATAFPPNAALGSDDNSGSRTKPFATIQKAVDTVLAMNDGTSPYTIYVDGTLDGTTAALPDDANGMADFSALTQDLTLTIKALSGTATLDGGARFNVADDGTVTVTADGIKKSIIYAKPASGTLALTLENLTITGGNTAYGGGVYVRSGTFTMDGGTITDNIATKDGGGVYVNGGTFMMDSGTISGNMASEHGGGVYISSNGIFTMNGGEISGNKAPYGGGVYLSSSTSTFTMKDGTITGNTATKFDGGGLYLYQGCTFTMDGGTITDNTAKTSGGGVEVRIGTFTMNGGTIKNCTAGSSGGGVHLLFNTAIFTMNGGEISGNKAPYGGGVYNIGTFEMKKGTITGNTAITQGGGVCNTASATFTNTDGTISGNLPDEVYPAP